MKVNIKLLRENVVVPTRATEESAGYDLYANFSDPDTESLEIQPGQTVLIPIGIAMEIPKGLWGGVYARSGLACKHGLIIPNGVGVIDADYRGEIYASLHNISGKTYTINRGDRVAQLIIQPYVPVDLGVVDELDDTCRSTGGFGSTGR